jgi:hypothetical protein
MGGKAGSSVTTGVDGGENGGGGGVPSKNSQECIKHPSLLSEKKLQGVGVPVHSPS